MAKSVSAGQGNQAKPQQNPWSQVRCVFRQLRVSCLLSRRSRVPRHAKASSRKPIKHDVAASLKIPRSPPMQFQPVSRSTHAVCTSGTLHIVPLLLTAHNLLIKIPVLALPLSHDSDPFLLNPGTRYGSFPALSQHHMYLNKVRRKARRAQMMFLCIATGCVLYLVVCKCMLRVSSQTDLCRNLLPSSVLPFCLRYLCVPLLLTTEKIC